MLNSIMTSYQAILTQMTIVMSSSELTIFLISVLFLLLSQNAAIIKNMADFWDQLLCFLYPLFMDTTWPAAQLAEKERVFFFYKKVLGSPLSVQYLELLKFNWNNAWGRSTVLSRQHYDALLTFVLEVENPRIQNFEIARALQNSWKRILLQYQLLQIAYKLQQSGCHFHLTEQYFLQNILVSNFSEPCMDNNDVREQSAQHTGMRIRARICGTYAHTMIMNASLSTMNFRLLELRRELDRYRLSPTYATAGLINAMRHVQNVDHHYRYLIAQPIAQPIDDLPPPPRFVRAEPLQIFRVVDEVEEVDEVDEVDGTAAPVLVVLVRRERAPAAS